MKAKGSHEYQFRRDTSLGCEAHVATIFESRLKSSALSSMLTISLGCDHKVYNRLFHGPYRSSDKAAFNDATLSPLTGSVTYLICLLVEYWRGLVHHRLDTLQRRARLRYRIACHKAVVSTGKRSKTLRLHGVTVGKYVLYVNADMHSLRRRCT
jgi:hypothetical protein